MNDKIVAAKQAVTGVIAYGVANSSALPTDAKTALGEGFTYCGDISENGIKYNSTLTSNPVKNMSGEIVQSLSTGRESTYKVELLETDSKDTLVLIFPDVTEVGGKITVASNGKELEAHSFVLDMAISPTRIHRVVIPNGKVTAIDEISYASSDVTKYGVTITCMNDENGNDHYDYYESK